MLPPVPDENEAGPERVAICVLPFANMSGDPEQAYFSDGITEDERSSTAEEIAFLKRNAATQVFTKSIQF